MSGRQAFKVSEPENLTVGDWEPKPPISRLMVATPDESACTEDEHCWESMLLGVNRLRLEKVYLPCTCTGATDAQHTALWLHRAGRILIILWRARSEASQQPAAQPFQVCHSASGGQGSPMGQHMMRATIVPMKARVGPTILHLKAVALSWQCYFPRG